MGKGNISCWTLEGPGEAGMGLRGWDRGCRGQLGTLHWQSQKVSLGFPGLPVQGGWVWGPAEGQTVLTCSLPWPTPGAARGQATHPPGPSLTPCSPGLQPGLLLGGHHLLGPERLSRAHAHSRCDPGGVTCQRSAAGRGSMKETAEQCHPDS